MATRNHVASAAPAATRNADTIVAEPLREVPAASRPPADSRHHILVVTGSYAPDRTGMAPLNTELCEHLASRGHKVSVVTCFPHYPEWKFPESCRGKLWLRETRNGVSLVRSRVWLPAKRTALRRENLAESKK